MSSFAFLRANALQKKKTLDSEGLPECDIENSDTVPTLFGGGSETIPSEGQYSQAKAGK